IRAPKNHELWSLDLQQAELRIASKYAGCRKMLEQLAQGADIHVDTTRRILGAKKTDPDWKLKRDIGKRLTFSSIFQIGPDYFQETLTRMSGIQLPLAECQR